MQIQQIQPHRNATRSNWHDNGFGYLCFYGDRDDAGAYFLFGEF